VRALNHPGASGGAQPPAHTASRLGCRYPFAWRRRQQDMLANLVVRDELANKMSFFFAVPTPMLNAIVNATTNFVNSVRGVARALQPCEARAQLTRKVSLPTASAAVNRTTSRKRTCLRCWQPWRPSATTLSTTPSVRHGTNRSLQVLPQETPSLTVTADTLHSHPPSDSATPEL